MVNYFIDNINRYFRLNEYGYIETNNKKIYSYLKRAQDHVYIVNILDINIYPIEDWQQAIKSYEKAVDIHFKDIPANKKIILNIFIAENDINLIYNKLKNIPVEYDNETMSINWFVDVKNKELMIPPDHPHQILGVEKQILKQLYPEKYSEVKKGKKKLKLVTKNNKTIITFVLMFINIFIWILLEVYGGSTNSDVLIKFGANHTGLIFIKHQYWRLFTSMFIHVGIAHLAYNIFALYIFGIRIEKYLDRRKFLELYIISGIMASFVSSVVVAVIGVIKISAGASGAIFGLEGSALALTKESGKELGNLSAYLIFIIIIFGLMMGYIYKNIDNVAHISGLITGYLLTILFIKQS